MGDGADSLARQVPVACTDSRDPVARRQALLLALSAHAAVRLCNAEHVAQYAPRLRAAFELTRAWGGQDYCAWVLCIALSAIDEVHQARSVATEYLTVHRRETFTAPTRLHQFTE